MIYIAEITPSNSPPSGCLNIGVTTVPDTYAFFTEIPLNLMSDKQEIVTRIIAYCSGNELPIPDPSEVFVKTMFL